LCAPSRSAPYPPPLAAVMGNVSSYCCGGRQEKLQEYDPRQAHDAKAGFPECPDDKEQKFHAPRGQPRDSALKKLGKSCCCGGVGDRAPKPDSSAPKPELMAAAAAAAELEDAPAMPKATELAGAPKQALKQDFSGTWLLDSIEGDMDAFLSEYGRGWIFRMAARNMNFGIGSATMTIQQDGDSMSVKKVLASGAQVNIEYLAGGDEFESTEDLGTCTFKAKWDNGGALREEGTVNGDLHILNTRSRLGPKELCDCTESCQGTVVKQVYKLVEEEG